MSKLEELLQGVDVEWKSLSEIGEISGAGVDKKIIESEKSIKLLNYMDIYRNKYITKDIPSMIVSASDIKIKQCNVLKGDIFFTPSSEVLNDIGKSSVALENIDGVVYSYHIMRLRLSNPNIITSMYVNYMLGSDNVQNQINKKAKGLTRFGLTKTQWQQIVIPIPCPDNPEKSLEIQQEIVRVLDELTSLTNQLTTELEKERQIRKRQFEFYREQLFTFEEGKAEWKSLKDVAEYSKKRINFTFLNESNYVGVDNLLQNRGGKINSKHIPTEGNSTAFLTNNILIGNIRPYLKKIWLADCDGGSNGDVLVINIYDKIIHHKYLYHILSSDEFFKYNMQHAKGAKMPRGNKQKIMEYIFPIPSLEEQERIVKLLDQFDATHTAIEEEITKEIKLRTQQYEYYREKLLTFPEN